MSYLGENIKKLGFGLMRPPMIGEDVDIEQLKQMVDLFLAHGYTYFDSAYGYLAGKSEEAAKIALVERYPRESYQFATKLPAWAAPDAEAAKEMFWTSLKRTGLAYFDYYLLHNLGLGRTEAFASYGIWDFLAEQKEQGRIKHLGFSIHATPEHLEEILSQHPEMEFVQLQLNYADWEDHFVQARRTYEIARKYEKPVIVMEPVKGGALADPPRPVAEILEKAVPGASLASWALRYVASLEGIVTVLSGMSNLAQMQDNLSVMDDFQPFSAAEAVALRQAQEMLAGIPHVPCTDCRYCVEGGACPVDVAIPGIFRALNHYLVYDDLKAAKGNYQWETGSHGKADACIGCGKCETACPQGIEIRQELAKAAALFGA